MTTEQADPPQRWTVSLVASCVGVGGSPSRESGWGATHPG